MTATAAPSATAPAVLPADPLDLVPRDAVVAVAMSGGVDSSVAAARCVERGLRTVGITLAMWPRGRPSDRDRGCCSVDAVEDARRVAAHLGIRHYPWDLEDEFAESVIADYVDEYAAGRTPNPCIRCNDRVKFGALLERARAVGASHLATGHYARIGRRDRSPTLHRGLDRRKDQSYTLYRLGADRLAAAVFPVGGMADKAAVRAEASRLALHLAGKAESQELCFVRGRVRDDLRERLHGRFGPGPVVDLDGRRVGEHDGLPFLTVGQRSGLRLRPATSTQPPRYVVRIDVDTNTVVVGDQGHSVCEVVVAHRCAWVGRAPRPGDRCAVQMRAHGSPLGAAVEAVGPGTVRVRLDTPAPAVAPGQSAVLYRDDEVVGGGLVERTVP